MTKNKLRMQTIAAACSLALASLTSMSVAHASGSSQDSMQGSSGSGSSMQSGGMGSSGSGSTQSGMGSSSADTSQSGGTGSSGSGSSGMQSGGMGSAGYGSPQSGTGTSSADTSQSGGAASSGAAQSASGAAGGTAASSEVRDTMQQVKNATEIVKQMESDPQVKKLMQQAKGIFLVPQYGRAGLGIGGRGGEGVLLVNNNGKWSNPVFYNIGGVSIGAQAGAEIGQMAMLLMNQKAVQNFMQENNFSLTASAGLTIVNYTAKAQASAARGDVIVWSDTEGAFANATVGVVDINYDEDENAAFYKKQQVSAKDITGGKVQSAEAKSLTKELSSGR